MKRSFYWIFLSVLFFTISTSYAIPAFARKYKISCTTCHAPFPRLKAYGEEFAGNGFALPEGEKDRDYVDGGDDLLYLNRDFPLAVRTDLFVTHSNDSKPNTDLATPWGMKLLSGGWIYKNIGYYFYFYISERGEVAGIEDAYLHFNNIGGRELDLMVGQFQISDPLLKRELRLTYEDYIAYTYAPLNSSATLKYDRGFMATYSFPKSGTDLFAMVVNGNGKVDFGPDRIADDNQFKNFGFRLIQTLGDQISVGGFYYRGKEEIPNGQNSFYYIGPDLSVTTSKVHVVAQYLFRNDDGLLPTGEKVKTSSILAEATFLPEGENGRKFLTYLFNFIENDLDKYHSHTLNVSHLLSRNVRVIGEMTYELETKNLRFVLGTVAAF